MGYEESGDEYGQFQILRTIKPDAILQKRQEGF